MREAKGKTQATGNTQHRWWAVRRWSFVVVWMGVIFWFSALPDYALPDLGAPDTLIKKGAHIAEYAILGWLIQRAQGTLGAKRAWWLPWLLAVAYAATDEFHQSWTPGRNPRMTDVMIDSFGAAIGVGLAVWRAGQRMTNRLN